MLWELLQEICVASFNLMFPKHNYNTESFSKHTYLFVAEKQDEETLSSEIRGRISEIIQE